MNKKILVFGKGYIGEKVAKFLGAEISSAYIQSIEDILRIVRTRKPDIVINCIGYTGKNNVDDCELVLSKTLNANTFIPIMFAEVCLRHNIKLVHLSSGCIFHYDYKQLPINETKIPDFFNLYYSRSKIYSERALEVAASQYNFLILRIRIPLDCYPHPKNLLTKLIKYRQVIDMRNSVTYIPDFLKALKHLININARGIFNVVSRGGLKYCDLMEEYRKFIPAYQYRVIPYKSLKVTRTNLILSTKRLEKSGFKVRSIKQVMNECVKRYVQ